MIVAEGVFIPEHPQAANQIHGETEKVEENRELDPRRGRTPNEDGLGVDSVLGRTVLNRIVFIFHFLLNDSWNNIPL